MHRKSLNLCLKGVLSPHVSHSLLWTAVWGAGSHFPFRGFFFPSDALKHGAVFKLISLHFNKRVCVVRHCYDKDHKTSQEFTLVWLIIINSAVPLALRSLSRHGGLGTVRRSRDGVRCKRIPALKLMGIQSTSKHPSCL